MTPPLSNRLAPVARALRLVIPSLILSGCAVGLDTSIQPAPHWTYEGKTLKNIYEETYSDEEE